MALTLADQAKFAEAEEILLAVLESRRRVLGIDHPDTLETAQGLEHVRSAIMRAAHTKKAGKTAVRRAERAAAPALSSTALAEAEARARAAEAELLALLDLEEPDAAAGNGSSGKGKGKAKGIGKARGPGGK